MLQLKTQNVTAYSAALGAIIPNPKPTKKFGSVNPKSIAYNCPTFHIQDRWQTFPTTRYSGYSHFKSKSSEIN
tara:strand:+ start:31 stop:249 length:219 start_codon:yes stop_codon:yes gene_type:complete